MVSDHEAFWMGTAFALGVFLGAAVALIGLNAAYRRWKGIG